MHIHVKDEVSMTNYMDRRAYKRKLPKYLPFRNYKNYTNANDNNGQFTIVEGSLVHKPNEPKISSCQNKSK